MASNRTDEPIAESPVAESLGHVLGEGLARRRMNLTQLRDRLAARGFRVSLATLSYWRSGQRRPETAESLDALAAVEEILGLAPGRLLYARGPSKRTGPRKPVAAPGDVVPPTVLIGAALLGLGLKDWAEHLCEDVATVSADVDREGNATRFTYQLMIRALTPQAQHYPVYVFAGQPVPEPLKLMHLRGAAVTGHVADEQAGLSMWRTSLPAPLLVGETAMIEAEVRLPWLGGPDTELVYYCQTRLSSLTIWVRFDPERLPSTCSSIIEPHGERPRRVPVDVTRQHSAHVSIRASAPAVRGSNSVGSLRRPGGPIRIRRP